MVGMTEQHEIRVDGDRAWCETCGWSEVTHGLYGAWSRACLHFSGRDPQALDGDDPSWPFWGGFEFCEWPDRVWPAGPPRGATGATEWPRTATWQWDLGDLRHGTSWVLACDEHAHLGPAKGPRVHCQRLVAA